jgi:hypothetical protein
MRRWMLTLAALAAAAPLAAQDHGHHGHHDHAGSASGAAQQGALPSGWQARLDRANASLSNVKFVPGSDGYRVTLGPSGIFFNPGHTAGGEYTAQARFTQLAPTPHPEAYGLLIGGRELDGPNQDYLYFLVRQDGRFMIRHRGGAEVHTIQEWTEHPAINRVVGEAGATNTLAIEAGPRRARFLINGVQVANFADVAHLNTAGIVGLRINHNLDVLVQDFAIRPASR